MTLQLHWLVSNLPHHSQICSHLCLFCPYLLWEICKLYFFSKMTTQDYVSVKLSAIKQWHHRKEMLILSPWRGRLSLCYHRLCVFQLLKSNSIFEIAHSVCTACVCFQQHTPVIALSLFVLYLQWSNLQCDYNDFIWDYHGKIYLFGVYIMQTADANWSVGCKNPPPTREWPLILSGVDKQAPSTHSSSATRGCSSGPSVSDLLCEVSTGRKAEALLCWAGLTSLRADLTREVLKHEGSFLFKLCPAFMWMSEAMEIPLSPLSHFSD